MRSVTVIWVTDRSLDFSVASQWLHNRGEIEIKIHYQSSHAVISSPWGSGEGTMISPQGVSARRLLWIWRLPSKSLHSLYWARSGLHLDWKTSGDQGRGIPGRDPKDSTLPSAEPALQSFNQSQGELEGVSPTESQQIECDWMIELIH